MGVSLTGRRSDVSYNWITYTTLLRIGHACGWKPMGTLRESCYYCPECGGHDDDPWQGSYSCNEGQWVQDRDARALAKALRHVIDDPISCDKAVTVLRQGSSDPICEFVEAPVTREDAKTFVAPFAKFCEDGGFNID